MNAGPLIHTMMTPAPAFIDSFFQSLVGMTPGGKIILAAIGLLTAIVLLHKSRVPGLDAHVRWVQEQFINQSAEMAKLRTRVETLESEAGIRHGYISQLLYCLRERDEAWPDVLVELPADSSWRDIVFTPVPPDPFAQHESKIPPASTPINP